LVLVFVLLTFSAIQREFQGTPELKVPFSRDVFSEFSEFSEAYLDGSKETQGELNNGVLCFFFEKKLQRK
jgi:hypothetical protein